MSDLAAQLKALGLAATAASLDDLLARAIKHRLAPRDLLEEIVRSEAGDRSRRSLERRRVKSRLGSFKPIADFDWNWPKKIDRPLIERAVSLEFLREGRNLVLLGPNGVGKTMLSKNIADQAVLAGYSVLFRTAAELLDDVQCDSPERRRQRIAAYTRPHLLASTRSATSPTTTMPPISSTKSSTRAMKSGAPCSSLPTSPLRTGTASFPTPPASSPHRPTHPPR